MYFILLRVQTYARRSLKQVLMRIFAPKWPCENCFSFRLRRIQSAVFHEDRAQESTSTRDDSRAMISVYSCSAGIVMVEVLAVRTGTSGSSAVLAANLSEILKFRVGPLIDFFRSKLRTLRTCSHYFHNIYACMHLAGYEVCALRPCVLSAALCKCMKYFRHKSGTSQTCKLNSNGKMKL